VSGASGADAIRVIGSTVSVEGSLFARSGGVLFVGHRDTFHCAAVAGTIRVLGAFNRFAVDESTIWYLAEA